MSEVALITINNGKRETRVVESEYIDDPNPSSHIHSTEVITIQIDRNYIVMNEIINEGEIINNGGTLGVI